MVGKLRTALVDRGGGQSRLRGAGVRLRHWVDDGLMTLFSGGGMKVTREVMVGELRDRRTVRVPVLAALGGMILPALIFLAVNAGGAGVRGWGVAMATDIASGSK